MEYAWMHWANYKCVSSSSYSFFYSFLLQFFFLHFTRQFIFLSVCLPLVELFKCTSRIWNSELKVLTSFFCSLCSRLHFLFSFDLLLLLIFVWYFFLLLFVQIKAYNMYRWNSFRVYTTHQWQQQHVAFSKQISTPTKTAKCLEILQNCFFFVFCPYIAAWIFK